MFLGSRWVIYIIASFMSVSAFSTTLPGPGATANEEARKSSQINVNSWYTLDDGSEVSVIAFSPNGDQVQIATDDLKGEPVFQWISLAELQSASPRLVDIDALENLADLGMLVVSIEGRGGMTYCLRDVRIRAARYTRRVPQNISMASIAYPKYKAMGWKPIEYSVRVPQGTACFFGGGRPCGRGTYCGHAAIKIGSNRWLGAGVTPTPFLRNRSNNGRVAYRFHGCLTPPNKTDSENSGSSKKAK